MDFLCNSNCGWVYISQVGCHGWQGGHAGEEAIKEAEMGVKMGIQVDSLGDSHKFSRPHQRVQIDFS